MSNDYQNVVPTMGIDELAEYLDMSKSTIYKLSQSGKIPGTKVGRYWRYKREFIDEWLAANGGRIAITDDSESYGAQSQAPSESVSDRPEPEGDDLKRYFTAEQVRQLHSCSIRSISSVLTALATNRGRNNLSVLLKVTLEQLDKIATRITDDIPPGK